MKGRRPKPTALKELQGNPGKRKPRSDEPKPTKTPRLPNCPRRLKGEARAAWRTIGGRLVDMQILTVADLTGLEILCEAYAEYVECRQVIAEKGRTYTSYTESGKERAIRPRPEIAMAQKAWERFKYLLLEYGLTPSSRTRIGVVALPPVAGKHPVAEEPARPTGPTGMSLFSGKRTG